jgi:hypothetical protein
MDEVGPWVHMLCFCDQFTKVPWSLWVKKIRCDPEGDSYYAWLQAPSPSETEEERQQRWAAIQRVERRCRRMLEEEREDEVAEWDIAAETKFQSEWWRVAKSPVADLLRTFDLSLSASEDGRFLLVLKRGPKPLTYAELFALQKKIEEKLFSPNLFSYHTIVSTLLSTLVPLFQSHCSSFFDVSLLNSIYAKPSTPFGEEWSAQFDIAFEGGGEGGNLVLYPDANQFNPFLIQYWDSIARSPGRVYIDFVARCLKAVSHEIVHCIQSKVKQQDTHPLSWSAEHDASYLSGSLLHAVAGHPKLREVLFEGWWEWLVQDWVDECTHQHYLYPSYSNKEYKKWRDSFGLVAPSDDVLLVRPGVAYYFKNFIALESMVANSSQVKERLSACFEGRVGDVYQCPIYGLAAIKNVKSDVFYELSSLCQGL